MLKVGDNVKIISGYARLKEIGIFENITSIFGIVVELKNTFTMYSSLLPIEVEIDGVSYFFAEKDLLKIESTTDAVKILEDRYSKKETNPKDAVGVKKVPTWFIPTCPQMELGLAMMEGARKYGAFNWRVAGVRGSVYYDAAIRHLNSWKEGQDTDPDSGLPHLIKAAACLFVLRDSIIMNNWTDDRPPTYPQRSLPMEFLNGAAGKLIEKYPDCKEPFTELNTEK